jgi:hypothetical protein
MASIRSAISLTALSRSRTSAFVGAFVVTPMTRLMLGRLDHAIEVGFLREHAGELLARPRESNAATASPPNLVSRFLRRACEPDHRQGEGASRARSARRFFTTRLFPWKPSGSRRGCQRPRKACRQPRLQLPHQLQLRSTSGCRLRLKHTGST